MEILLSVAALIISVVSLALSFLQGYDKKPTIHGIKIKKLNDGFDLLFNDNCEAEVELVNYNNRDVLLYLKEGYVEANNQKHLIKPEYYTAKANSTTKIKIEILTEVSSSMKRKSKEEKVYIVFQYKGLLFKRNCKLIEVQG